MIAEEKTRDGSGLQRKRRFLGNGGVEFQPDYRTSSLILASTTTAHRHCPHPLLLRELLSLVAVQEREGGEDEGEGRERPGSSKMRAWGRAEEERG